MGWEHPLLVAAGIALGVATSHLLRRRPWRFDITIRHRDHDDEPPKPE